MYDPFPLEELVEYIDWTPFLPDLGDEGSLPRAARPPRTRRGGAGAVRRCRRLLDEILEDGSLTARAIAGLYPANARGRRPRLLLPGRLSGGLAGGLAGGCPTRVAAGSAPPAADGSLVGRERQPGRFHLARDGRGHRLERRLCRDGRDRPGGTLRPFRGGRRRLPEPPREVARRPAGRGAGRTSARDRADGTLGVRTRRSARQRGPGSRSATSGSAPAPGYPACPDHSQKALLFDLLDVERRVGIRLTENYAMHPAASVSGVVLREAGRPGTSVWAASGSTRWRTTPRAAASLLPRRSAVCRPTSDTTGSGT